MDAKARRKCLSLLRNHAKRNYGSVRWEVRSAPVDGEDDGWDGTLWNLVMLQKHGKAGMTYRAEAYKKATPEDPYGVYEVLLPCEEHPAGIVFRRTVKSEGGILVFDLAEVADPWGGQS